MSNSADLTVVITCYEAGVELQHAINSVKAQSLKARQILLIDDGSNNCFCQTLSESDDVQVMRAPHAGQNRAVNLALGNVNTKFIAFLDDDDEWFPSKSQRQISLLESNSRLRAVFGSVRNALYKGDTLVSYKDFPPSRLLGSTMFRRDVFEMVGGFPNDQSMHGIIHWWSRGAKLLVPALAHDDLVLQRRIDHSNEGVQKVGAQRIDLLARLRTHIQGR